PGASQRSGVGRSCNDTCPAAAAKRSPRISRGWPGLVSPRDLSCHVLTCISVTLCQWVTLLSALIAREISPHLYPHVAARWSGNAGSDMQRVTGDFCATTNQLRYLS